MENRAYSIVVEGEISPRLAALFEGMEVEPANGYTTIAGSVTDQSHLNGVLQRIAGLNLKLVRVELLQDD
jgi:hypothetical protein